MRLLGKWQGPKNTLLIAAGAGGVDEANGDWWRGSKEARGRGGGGGVVVGEGTSDSAWKKRQNSKCFSGAVVVEAHTLDSCHGLKRRQKVLT